MQSVHQALLPHICLSLKKKKIKTLFKNLFNHFSIYLACENRPIFHLLLCFAVFFDDAKQQAENLSVFAV